MDEGARGPDVDEEVLRQVRRGLLLALGTDVVTASISFVGVEPIEILRFEAVDRTNSYVSLGMSRRPMNSTEQSTTALSGPRSELLLRTRRRADDVLRPLAVVAAAPAVEGLVCTPDSTIDLGIALAMGSRCTGGVLAPSGLDDIDSTAGAVSVLRLLPATQTELAWCRVRGVAALHERWTDQGTDLEDLLRFPADLTG